MNHLNINTYKENSNEDKQGNIKEVPLESLQ